eukprot:scaffold3662_cov178-Skeletonema_dohrnii-CCMP3373.AAC.1
MTMDKIENIQRQGISTSVPSCKTLGFILYHTAFRTLPGSHACNTYLSLNRGVPNTRSSITYPSSITHITSSS